MTPRPWRGIGGGRAGGASPPATSGFCLGSAAGAGAQGSLTAQVRLGGVRIFRFPMVIRVRVVHAADLREWYIENGFR